jgi:5-methylcytosine-specific restriction enzyme A
MSRNRDEFTKATKLQAWSLCKGRCNICLTVIIGTPQYDHIVPDAVDGGNEITNCQVLCTKCHRVKTSSKDVPEISRSVRILEKRAGVRSKRGGFRCAPDGFNTWTREWER